MDELARNAPAISSALSAANSFVAHGLTGPAVRCDSRTIRVTIDFEAFHAGIVDRWCDAMNYWAARAGDIALPCTFFISVEHAARLRFEDPQGYSRFIGAVRRLHGAGASFQPHNHRVFDPETGHEPTPVNVPKHVPGYARQASMFYDVRHRNKQSFADWLPQMLTAYDSFCSDAGFGRPERLAFRPGGWDGGSTAAEQLEYIVALRSAGFELHSGDSRGIYGTRSYRVDTPFGRNLYSLVGGLVELAPCWSLNLGVSHQSVPFGGSLARLLAQPVWRELSQPGAFVVVLHFDHLFHTGWRSSYREFAVRTPEEVHKRIDRALTVLTRLHQFLHLEPARLEAPLWHSNDHEPAREPELVLG